MNLSRAQSLAIVAEQEYPTVNVCREMGGERYQFRIFLECRAAPVVESTADYATHQAAKTAGNELIEHIRKRVELPAGDLTYVACRRCGVFVEPLEGETPICSACSRPDE